jgi:adenosylcobinamide-phosphate synthase
MTTSFVTLWNVIALALILDSLLGDPRYPFHPVRIIGIAADTLETLLRKSFGASIVSGLIGWLAIVGASSLLGLAVPALAGIIASLVLPGIGVENPLGPGIASNFAKAFLIYTTIAPRDMAGHALRVFKALEDSHCAPVDHSLERARSALAMIVGRDVHALEKEGIIAASIESVAESTIDGVLAPLFWALIAGAPGALAYRAINTLDSMWGHRNQRYERFGKIAARADDAATWLPARLGFAAAIAATLVLSLFDPRHFSPIRGLRIGWRDRLKHESPNSAWMEALTAGALGIRLAGPATYEGILHDKPYLGEALRHPDSSDIKRAILLMYGTTIVFFLLSRAVAAFLPLM